MPGLSRLRAENSDAGPVHLWLGDPGGLSDGVGRLPGMSNLAVPLRWVGPVRISGGAVSDHGAVAEVEVPLATFETPLWPSVGRGAAVSRAVPEGISVEIVDERMTRSVLLVADRAAAAVAALHDVLGRRDELARVAAETSAHVCLIDLHGEVVGDLLYLRFEYTTGDAAGHNMATKASDRLLQYLLAGHPELSYGSISANYCADKKATAVNGILGRGRSAVAELIVPAEVARGRLRTSAARLADLNLRKNLIGSTLAGAVRSANAHYANMLLAVYLATGQDAANIVEGSQGVTHVEDRGGDAYFSCTLPNLVVGTVGNGKGREDAVESLRRLGCLEEREPGANSRRLAAVIAATVLCGELSLMAAQTNPGELTAAHMLLERGERGGR